ncbi:MAG: TRAP transporter small permease subunit [Rhodospirillales bacterium]
MPGGVVQRSAGRFAAPAVRVFAFGAVFLAAAYVLNAVLIFWLGWPGVRAALSGGLSALGVTQIGLYVFAAAAPVVYAALSLGRAPRRALEADSAVLSAWAGFIIRWAFWAVLLVGAVDAVISFLRVEGLLDAVFGETLAGDLGRPRFRGVWVHCPLLVFAGLIALRVRSLGFPWLAFLIVFVETQIVIARFVFSYEQAFMADLVRFWYAGLFLFASPYTLLTNGHVRVDVLYAGFSARAKARVNAVGAAVLGFPFCWVIITSGMGGARNIITGPLLGFEVSQSGYGMYVKYLLAGYLLVFAAAMLIQFAAMLLSAAAVLLDSEEPEDAAARYAHGAPPAPAQGAG